MSTLDIGIIIGFLIVTVWVGFLKGRSVKSFKDFAVGAKNYTFPVLVSTTAATWFGGGDTMGLAGEVSRLGVFVGVFYSLQFFSDFLIARVVSPRMAGHAQKTSIGDMALPYYGRLGSILISAAAILKTYGAVAIQVSAVGSVLQIFLGIPFVYGALLGMGIIIAYTTFGGIRAVIYTDVLQFAFLAVSIPTIGNLLISSFGGFSDFMARIPETHITLSTDQAVLTTLFGIGFAQLIPMLNPLIMHRFFLNKNTEAMRKSLTATAFMELPLFFFVTVVGLSAVILYPGVSADLSFVTLITESLPIGVKGLVAVGLIAAIMSSADSAVNLNSILFVNDIFKPAYARLKSKEPSEKRLLRTAMIFNIISSTLAVIIAIQFGNILDIILYFVAAWTPVAIIPLYGILFRTYVSQRTFIWSVISGISSLLIWEFFLKDSAPIIPGFFIGLVGNAVMFFSRYMLIDRHNQKLQEEKNAFVPDPMKKTKKKRRSV